MTDAATQRKEGSAALGVKKNSAFRENALRSIPSEFLRVAVFPIYLRRQLPAVYRNLADCQKWEFASPEDLATLQWKRLRAMLSHAAARVPYYRELLRESKVSPEDLREPQDLARLPVLTKGIVQRRLTDLVDEQSDVGRRMKNATGGSTGQPVQFFQDSFYWEYARATQWFVEGWWGIRPGDRTASIWGCDRDLPEQTWGERLYGTITQTRVCNAFSLSEEPMDRFASMLVRWNPRLVVGYASALELFARFILSRQKFSIRPIAVKSSAEVLTDPQRKVIEQAFDAPLYNFYGSREINNLAAECPARQGLHINALGRYVEVVDDDGRQLPPGEAGRILVTDLTNRTMPFIRYQLDDVGSWADGSCSCGRPFPRLAKVWGRSSDFITTPDGKKIHGEYFTHLFYDLPQIQTFQLVQRTAEDVSLDYVLRPGALDFNEGALRRKIQDALGSKMHCEIKRVMRIDRPPSGKHRFTISMIQTPLGNKNTVVDNA